MTLADGQQVSADLLIDASGVWSKSASDVLRNEPYDAGYSGVLALSDPLSSPATNIGTEYWGRDERFGDFDLGNNRRYWFYIQGRRCGPPDFSHEELLERAAAWPLPIQHAVSATLPDRLIPVAIRARPAPRRLGRGRFILVGDAAHAMEPNLGQGACQALEDAAALSVVAKAVPPALVLDGFEALRLARVRKFVALSARAAWPVHAGPIARTLVRAAAQTIPNGVHQMAISRLHGPAVLAAG